MGTGCRDLLGARGWERLHEGGPPFTLSDYRVFVTTWRVRGAARSVTSGPAVETALGAFRRALEGTLSSAGATVRRLEPDGLLPPGNTYWDSREHFRENSVGYPELSNTYRTFFETGHSGTRPICVQQLSSFPH